MTIYNIGDITGDGSAHHINVDANIRAKWVRVLADSGNSGVVRVGGPDTSSSIGFPLTKGESILYPQDQCDTTNFYQVSGIYYEAGSNDKLYVQYGAG